MRIVFLPLVLLVAAAAHAAADTFALFYALDADAAAFAQVAKPLGQPVSVGTRRLQRHRLGPHLVITVKMGSGCVETAASAQALLTRFPCDRAYSLGPVGALSDSLSPGNLVRVTRVFPFQKGSHSGSDFQPAAPLPALPEPEPDPPPGRTWTHVFVASGELFCASDTFRAQLAADLGRQAGPSAPPLAIDMNLFGLLTVCRDHGVPLENYRVVSDRADDRASEEFRTFVSRYDGVLGATLAHHLETLPASPGRPDAYPALRGLISPEK